MNARTLLRPASKTTFSKKRSHGTFRVRNNTQTFGFQIHLTNAESASSVLFGLVSKDVKFSVRIDLESGEISDAANGMAVLGWLDKNTLRYGFTEPMVLRWEVERLGGALIPRLEIGEEEWLYPSILFPGESQFTATTAQEYPEGNSRTVFTPGYVWCQDTILN